LGDKKSQLKKKKAQKKAGNRGNMRNRTGPGGKKYKGKRNKRPGSR